jgi:hypothetical protein
MTHISSSAQAIDEAIDRFIKLEEISACARRELFERERFVIAHIYFPGSIAGFSIVDCC